MNYRLGKFKSDGISKEMLYTLVFSDIEFSFDDLINEKEEKIKLGFVA